ncbi:hypothetical protein ACGTNG_12805 [Halomonas sp. 1390]|uniref:hypothetical protein n=1 Tax=Halomonas sp. B23F22_3 TaxID=3459516 RepID=UPI00373EE305
MTPHPDSPNAKWARYGYRVERLPRRGAGKHHRIIRAPDGRAVLQDATHAEELDWIRDNLENAS